MMKSTYALLMDAIQSNNLAEFRSILKSEGLKNGSCWMDYDLLKRAIAINRKVIARYLLENGCTVYKRYDKIIPLHTAVAKKNWHDLVEKLLRLGSRVSARDTAGNTALHIAFKNHAPNTILDLLIESYLDETGINMRDEEELSVLHIACTRPKLELVKRFFHFHQSSIDSQVSLKSKSSNAGYTPLHFAVEHGRHEVVLYLLERGANLYLQNSNGSTPLHLALEHCDIKMVNLIFDYLSKFDNIVNSQGLSHFMIACASNDLSLIESYLSVANADSMINSRVKDVSGYPFAGYTPLHFAAVCNRVDVARLLLYSHGDELFWAATARNRTASSLALEKKRHRMTKLFSAYCEGGEVWEEEVRKIGKNSIVREIMLKVEEERFASCKDFKEFQINDECEVEGECIEDNICVSESEESRDSDDTLPVSDDDERENDLIDESIRAKEIVEREAAIGVTPLSTRTLRGNCDEIFLTRIRDLHKKSRRFFFNIDQCENESSEDPSFFRFLLRILSVVKPLRILIGFVLLCPMFALFM